MIKFEHVNLIVQDIPNALRFYKAAFPHWHVRTQGDGDWYGKPRKWVHFGDDWIYISFSNNGEGGIRDLTGHQSGLAHFAFSVQDLDALIERLTLAGFQYSKIGVKHPFRKNIYFEDVDGFEIEFVEYKSDLPDQRNSNG